MQWWLRRGDLPEKLEGYRSVRPSLAYGPNRWAKRVLLKGQSASLRGSSWRLPAAPESRLIAMLGPADGEWLHGSGPVSPGR